MAPEQKLLTDRSGHQRIGVDQDDRRCRVVRGLRDPRAFEELMPGDSADPAHRGLFVVFAQHPGEPAGAGGAGHVGVVDADDDPVRGF
jgi:hypothetical protein